MANPTGAFGLKPIRYMNGAPWNGATIDCFVSSSYATALYIGDPVLISPTAAERQTSMTVQGRNVGKIMPTINKSSGADGVIIFGVITGFEPLATDLFKQYNPASTERIAKVAVATPDLVFQIRGDGGGTPSKNWIGANAVCTASAGSTVTGFSGTELDEGTSDAPDADQSNSLLIVGAQGLGEESPLDDDTLWEVVINTCFNATGLRLGILSS